MADFSPACASEFPNDNPELHHGAVWVCLRPIGRARAIVRPAAVAETAPQPVVPGPALVVVPEPALVVAPEPAPEPAPVDDAWSRLLVTLAEVARDAGASRASAVVGSLLSGAAVDASLVGGDGLEATLSAGLSERVGQAIVLAERTAATAEAWRNVLCADGELGACDSTLDAWCAELLSALAGVPSRAEDYRRRLRARGVAAFGMLSEAA